MDDVRLGSLFRAARLKRQWRQCDAAAKAGVSRDVAGRVERGQLDGVRYGEIRRLARALEIDVDLRARWRGGDGERLLSARHSALVEGFTRDLVAGGWEPHPEASFSIWGERGVMDVLAWHPASATLLVVEVKTEIVDVGELLGTLNRKRRLAPAVAADLGLAAGRVGVCVILLDTRTNHRRLADHAATIRAALPADGRRLRAWLRHPDDPLAAMMFLPIDAPGRTGLGATGLRRVRVPRAAGSAAGPRSPAARSRRKRHPTAAPEPGGAPPAA